MRRSSFLSAVALVLLAAPSHAGTLTNATWFQVTEGIPMTRTSAQLGAAGTSTAASIAVTLSYPAFATTLFVPKTPNGALDLAVQVTQGGAQAITATPGMANGSPGIPGTAVFMTAVHAGMGVDQSMFMVGTNTVVEIPLSIGRDGFYVTNFLIFGVLHTLTVNFYAWTPGTLYFYGLTSLGDPITPPFTPTTQMGSFALTPKGGGTVTLVSPSKISIDGPFAQRRTVSVTKLALTFVPEPGTLLLLGGAGVALLTGRRRRPRPW